MTPVEKLKYIANEYGPAVVKLASKLLDDPNFATWTGSGTEGSHHYGRGLLAQHTLEVVEIALENNRYYQKLGKGANPGLLFLAALYHDAGKIKDYAYNATSDKWYNTDHKYEMHHISASLLYWDRVVQDPENKDFLTEDEAYQVSHAILSHHGLKAWGSPVEPRTRLAWLLHLSDNLSAHMDVPKFVLDRKK